jgi:cytidine deaminase
MVIGCNVENASIGLTLCAECAMLGQMFLTGGGRLVAVVAVDGAGSVLTPCGRCRQLLMEHGGPDLLVQGVRGPRPMRELLPDWFGPEDLPK